VEIAAGVEMYPHAVSVAGKVHKLRPTRQVVDLNAVVLPVGAELNLERLVPGDDVVSQLSGDAQRFQPARPAFASPVAPALGMHNDFSFGQFRSVAHRERLRHQPGEPDEIELPVELELRIAWLRRFALDNVTGRRLTDGKRSAAFPLADIAGQSETV